VWSGEEFDKENVGSPRHPQFEEFMAVMRQLDVTDPFLILGNAGDYHALAMEQFRERRPAFEPYSEGSDQFIETFRGARSRLHNDPVTGHQAFFPIPSSELLAEYYNGTFTGGSGDVKSKFTPEVIAYAKILKDKARHYGVGEQFSAHDVGCGFGALVYALQKIGLDASGNEVNREWVDAAGPDCQNKLSAEPLDVALGRLDHKVDLFTLYHVLEHLPDPLAAFKLIASHMSERGIIDIQVPNAHSFRTLVGGRRNDPQYTFPQHLNYFSPASMCSFLWEAGLEPISISTRPLVEHAYDDSPAGWETVLGLPQNLIVDEAAWAHAASENLLGGELLVVATLASNKTAPRDPNIIFKTQKALRAFTEGRRNQLNRQQELEAARQLQAQQQPRTIPRTVTRRLYAFVEVSAKAAVEYGMFGMLYKFAGVVSDRGWRAVKSRIRDLYLR
jgi:hypothetical protein